MNEKLNNWKNPLIAIVFLIIVAVAGYFYSTRERTSSDLLTGVTVTEGTSTVDGDLLTTLGKLKRLRLDDSIFKDITWQSLRDFGQTLAPEPKGRNNPFAPLSGE